MRFRIAFCPMMAQESLYEDCFVVLYEEFYVFL